ncbi:hypothetical protein FKM82_016366 [Ascaphus truei]
MRVTNKATILRWLRAKIRGLNMSLSLAPCGLVLLCWALLHALVHLLSAPSKASPKLLQGPAGTDSVMAALS